MKLIASTPLRPSGALAPSGSLAPSAIGQARPGRPAGGTNWVQKSVNNGLTEFKICPADFIGQLGLAAAVIRMIRKPRPVFRTPEEKMEIVAAALATGSPEEFEKAFAMAGAQTGVREISVAEMKEAEVEITKEETNNFLNQLCAAVRAKLGYFDLRVAAQREAEAAEAVEKSALASATDKKDTEDNGDDTAEGDDTADDDTAEGDDTADGA